MQNYRYSIPSARIAVDNAMHGERKYHRSSKGTVYSRFAYPVRLAVVRFWPVFSPKAWPSEVGREGSGTGLPKGIGVRRMSRVLETACSTPLCILVSAAIITHIRQDFTLPAVVLDSGMT